MEMDAGFPVESVIFLNSEHLIATAAGAVVRCVFISLNLEIDCMHFTFHSYVLEFGI